jgi:hypothetical protein
MFVLVFSNFCCSITMEVEDPLWKIPWMNLYALYVGPYNEYENERCFRAFTGVCVAVAETIFDRYQHPKHLSGRTELLMLLNYLKDYPTEDNGRAQFKLKTRTTYREKISSLIDYLNHSMNEIYLDRRYFYEFEINIAYL